MREYRQSGNLLKKRKKHGLNNDKPDYVNKIEQFMSNKPSYLKMEEESALEDVTIEEKLNKASKKFKVINSVQFEYEEID